MDDEYTHTFAVYMDDDSMWEPVVHNFVPAPPILTKEQKVKESSRVINIWRELYSDSHATHHQSPSSADARAKDESPND